MTRQDLQCDYQWGDGCSESYRCRACYWAHIASGEPEGVDCGLDPYDCMLVDGGACSEEAVCTDCSCPDRIGERWRCVWPGDECPACGSDGT